MKTAEMGSVSSATMRAEDLIPAFLDVLEACGHPQYISILGEALKLQTIIDAYGFHYVDTDMETASWILNEDIWDAMQDLAPGGCYFGAHPGNGADYGFWQCEDDMA